MVGFFVWIFLGGDPEIYEVNVFDYLTIPIVLAGFICALTIIPRNRLALKLVSSILNGILLILALGYAFL